MSNCSYKSSSEGLYDVVIIGAGLGGACAALALAQRGARVAVLESAAFPRHKVCGEWLSPEIFHTFQRLKVDDAVCEAQPAKVQHARIYAPHATSSTRSLEIALPRAGWGLSRYALDLILWRAMQQRGIATFPTTRVRKVEKTDDGFAVQTSQGEFATRFVLNAAGRNARFGQGFEKSNPNNKRVQRYVGFKAHFADIRHYDGAIELHAYEGGYCGVGAIENGRVNVCALAKYETVAGRSPQEFWTWQLEQSASLRERVRGATQEWAWMSTANISFGRRVPVENGVFHCGDSAGYIHPLTGNGMAMAARSGEVVAGILASALRGEISRCDAVELYTRAWHREFDTRLRWATTLEQLLISPRFSSAALEVLSRAPWLAQQAVVRTRGS